MINFSTSIPIEHYQQLLRISLDLASTLDLNALLNRINYLAMELTDSEGSSILFYDESKRELTFAVTNDPQAEAMLMNVSMPLNSIAGQVAQTCQPVFVPDVSKDNRFCDRIDNLIQFSTRSIMAAPMIAKSKVIGVLEVRNKKEGQFNESDLDKLQILCAQAAVAIENSRLFQQFDLISNFVHELRTPLTALSTINALQQHEDISTEQRHEYTSLIQHEIQRLTDLSNDYLDIARMESGRLTLHPTRFSISKLINECCDMMMARAQEQNLVRRREIDPNLPEIEADRDKIKQVLINLINNGIKYNRPGGSITVKARVDGHVLRIDICDTGIGVPQEEIPNLGKRFFRASNVESTISGTGLGLCICRHIIESHQGQLSIESQLGTGSTFTIQLPIT